jgi:hypothetical protein
MSVCSVVPRSWMSMMTSVTQTCHYIHFYQHSGRLDELCCPFWMNFMATWAQIKKCQINVTSLKYTWPMALKNSYSSLRVSSWEGLAGGPATWWPPHYSNSTSYLAMLTSNAHWTPVLMKSLPGFSFTRLEIILRPHSNDCPKTALPSFSSIGSQQTLKRHTCLNGMFTSISGQWLRWLADPLMLAQYNLGTAQPEWSQVSTDPHMNSPFWPKLLTHSGLAATQYHHTSFSKWQHSVQS